MRTAWVLLLAVGMAQGGCSRLLSLDEAACPCAAGWECCADSNVCVRSGSSCPEVVSNLGGEEDGGDTGQVDSGIPDGGAICVEPCAAACCGDGYFCDVTNAKCVERPSLGNIEIVYQTSSRGRTLVVGDTKPYEYVFRVRNLASRSVTVQLNAFFADETLPDVPDNAWTVGTSFSFRNVLGDEINTVTLDPESSGIDSASWADVVVELTTPPSAVVGQSRILRLQGSFPNVGNDEGIALSAGAIETTEPAEWVRFTEKPTLIAGTPSGASLGQPVTFRFGYECHSSAGARERRFRVVIQVTSPEAEASLFSMNFSAGRFGPTPTLDAAVSTSTNRMSEPLTINCERKGEFQVDVRRAPQAAGKTLIYTASLEIDDGAIKTDIPLSVEIKAK